MKAEACPREKEQEQVVPSAEVARSLMVCEEQDGVKCYLKALIMLPLEIFSFSLWSRWPPLQPWHFRMTYRINNPFSEPI